MSKQKCIRGIAVGMAAAVLLCTSSFTSAEARAEVVSDEITPIEMEIGGGDTAQPNGSQYRWYVKEENGKIYRRLYNATYGVWVTGWIVCL